MPQTPLKYHDLDTIADFGKQWQEYTENKGFYASMESLESLLHPLLDLSDIRGCHIADIGAGTGRYTLMFEQAGAKKIVALEPSDAYKILKEHTVGLKNVECLKKRAEEISENQFDLVFCIGVLQFVPDPVPALKAMGRSLKMGGRIFLWVYSEENNGIYLSMILPLRKLTTRLPHNMLKFFTFFLLPLAEMYALASRFFRLPMAEYLKNYFMKVDRYTRRVIIHDQLNPSYAKYYRRNELIELLECCGFIDIKIHHRMGYSWSVLARYRDE
jgi:SAM-dependent methyltransferase